MKFCKALILLLILASSYCSFFRTTQKKEENLKKEISKGITTETMVLNSLGIPSLVTSNSIGEEIWNYKNLHYSMLEINNGKTLVLWELTTGDSTEVPKPFHLLITLDHNDIVKDFEIIAITSDNYSF